MFANALGYCAGCSQVLGDGGSATSSSHKATKQVDSLP